MSTMSLNDEIRNLTDEELDKALEETKMMSIKRLLEAEKERRQNEEE